MQLMEDAHLNLNIFNDWSFGSLCFLKTLFLKAKTCCVSNPYHMTAIDCSFNTLMRFHLREIIFRNLKNGLAL